MPADDNDNEPSALAEALDQLYAVPPEEFVRVRKELAADLKARGEKVAARRVMEAHKPTRATWALNQVARRAPELLVAYVEARAAAEKAQSGSAPDALRASLDEFRQRAAAVVRAADDVLREAGGQPSPQERRQIGESLEAAGTDTSFLRARLLGGRLEKRAVVADPLAALGASAGARAGAADAPHAKHVKETHETDRKERGGQRIEEERHAREREHAEKARAEREAAERQRAEEEARARRQREIAEANREVAALEAAAHDARARQRDAEERAKAAAKAAEEAATRLEAAEARLRRLHDA